MDAEALRIFWFALLGVLLAGYAILDGFDLGVGILHLCVRTDPERRVLMNSIGPIWDGNEVWLVVFGGAIFAAFPKAYAAAFSGFYTPFMLVLLALIFRGVSMEFRSKQEWKWWRTAWDVAFFTASTLATFLFGVIVGNCLLGLPLGPDGNFTRAPSLLEVLFGDPRHPGYPSLIGLFAVATFAMHGSIYLYLKTEGALQQRIHGWMWTTFGIFLVMYIVSTIFTLATNEPSRDKFGQHPWAWVVVLLNVLAIANIPRAIYLGKPFYAFLSSACTIAAFTFLFGLTLFPNLITSSVDHAYDLSVDAAASTTTTLWVMTAMAFLGLPFVLTYTATVYWVFRGKVQIGKFSY
jgi:cytochrome bd ubiquinol oxidase subunit II